MQHCLPNNERSGSTDADGERSSYEFAGTEPGSQRSRLSHASIATVTAVSLAATGLAIAAWAGSAGRQVFGAHRERQSQVSQLAVNVFPDGASPAEVNEGTPYFAHDILISVYGASHYGEMAFATAGIEVPAEYQYIYDDCIDIVFGRNDAPIVSPNLDSESSKWMASDVRYLAAQMAIETWAIMWLDAAKAQDLEAMSAAQAGILRARDWFPEAVFGKHQISRKTSNQYLADLTDLMETRDVARFEGYQMAHGYMDLEPVTRKYPIKKFNEIFEDCRELYPDLSPGEFRLTKPGEVSNADYQAELRTQRLNQDACAIEAWVLSAS